MSPERSCVVVGGRGFLGKCLVQELLAATGADAWAQVCIMDIAPALSLSPEEQACAVTARAIEEGRLVYVQGDVTKLPDVTRAVQGTYAVFHMASLSPELDNFRAHYTVSVIGAKNVIHACMECGVRVLVYTSSASVVFDGEQDLRGVDEAFPYATKHLSVYGETKAQAEALVLAANGRNGVLRTCALRPSNIFGPGDVVLTPTLARNAAAGKLKFIIGDGTVQADWTYVENVAHAHVCAERALRRDQEQGTWLASGKAYFITNDDPWGIWDFLHALARELGYPVEVSAQLPAWLVIPLSHVVERATQALRPLGVKPSDFTPLRMKILTRWKVYSCERAHALLHYSPLVPIPEAIKRTAAANSHLRREVLSKN